MVLQNKKISFILLGILSFICFISLITALLVSYILSDNLESDVFNMESVIIPVVKNTDDDFTITKMSMQISEKQRIAFLKKLIKEYISIRYTVNGSDYLMSENLDYNNINTLSDKFFKVVSFDKINDDSSVAWNNSYKSFASGKDSELEKIKTLLSENTTRSVRFLSEPYKDGDWWSVKVEFIYKSPITYSLSSAKKEKYIISLNAQLNGLLSGTLPNPANLFKFKVYDLKQNKI